MLAEYGLSEEQGNEIIMAARAHWFEDEERAARTRCGTLPMRPRKRHAAERTCILSRRTAPRDELIRLALGPDGRVAPDVRARAPGRGAWIGVDRATLEAAQAKGKLKGALARAFKTNAAGGADDLGARIEAALEKAALDRLGLEARAGNLVARLREDRGGGAARRGLPAAPRRRRERRRAAQARSGLAGRLGRGGLGPAGSGFPGGAGPYCHWRSAAKMWYMSPLSIVPLRRV